MTDHEYRQHLAKSADAFDREIDRYEAILTRIRKKLCQHHEKVTARRARARNEKRPHRKDTLLKEADLIEGVIDSVRKVMA